MVKLKKQKDPNDFDSYQNKEDEINQEGVIPASPPQEEEQYPNQQDQETNYNEDYDSLNEAPSPQGQVYQTEPMPIQPQQMSSEEIQEIAESIVEEKWEELTNKLGNVNIWKETVDREINSIKQEIIRTQEHFNNLQRAVLNKVNEYNENIVRINSEMKALEGVFQKIIEPLTTNVKELSRITEKLKKKS